MKQNCGKRTRNNKKKTDIILNKIKISRIANKIQKKINGFL